MSTTKEQKICPVCMRPFSWRKKWEKNWESVRYCSKACSSGRYKKAKLKISSTSQQKKKY